MLESKKISSNNNSLFVNNNSLFVSQLYADKSHALRAHDLISQLTARADLFLKYSIFNILSNVK